MSVTLNGMGEKHARSLIQAGKVDTESSWSMSADEENALLGNDDWNAYAMWHLGIDAGATPNTKAHYKYPFGKAGKVYRAALIAIRQRASQQDATGIYDAAGKLIDMIDGDDDKSASGALEHKASRFEYKFVETPTTQGVFEGYGSVFGNEDSYGDVVNNGAFAQTLKDHAAAGTMPKMLLNHGGMGGWMSSPSPEDMLPIGKWSSMCEDSKGLECKGRLINLDTESGKRIYGAMKENALDGLSIGFIPKQFIRGAKANEPERTLTQVHLIEVSPVTFPANEAAMVSSVKSVEQILDFKGAVDFLRNAGGLSRAQSTAFISRLKSLTLRNAEVDPREADEVVATLTRRAHLLKT